jgi:hypothetical protein
LAPPEIAIYDSTFNCWRSEGITNVKFDENSRSIEFTTDKLGKFAALQDKKLDLPYQEWSITSVSEGVEFNLIANYTELKLQVNQKHNYIKIIGQVHEEVSGTSLVVGKEESSTNLEGSNSLANIYSKTSNHSAAAGQADTTEEDPNKSSSNLDLLRIKRPFTINHSTGETAVMDLKNTLTNKSVYLFPSLEQPCSIKKHILFENLVYTEMSLLLALNICQFSWTHLTSEQMLPKEKENDEEDLENKEGNLSNKASLATVKSEPKVTTEGDLENGEDGEPSRPPSPEVEIPINENVNFQELREYEMVLKYAPIQEENSASSAKKVNSGMSLSSDISNNSSEPDWRLLFARYPSGPCYRLLLTENDKDDDGNIIFSREKHPESNYHYDIFHAVLDDLGLDRLEYESRAGKVDLTYLKTISELLKETRVLTNSV